MDNEQDLTLTAEEIAIAEGKAPEAEIKDTPPPNPPPAAAAPADDHDDGQDGEEVLSEGDDNPKARRKVSYGALHKERQERQRIEREFAQHREMTAAHMARGEERMRQLAQAMEASKPKEEQPVPPDASIDPLGRIAYLESLIEKQGQTLETTQRRTQEHQVLSQVEQFAQQDEAQARVQAKEQGVDYDEAKKYLLMSRGRELFAQSGNRATNEQIQAQLALEERNLRIQAIQNGQRPSVVTYQLSVARGYQPKAAQPAATDTKIQEIAAAQEANKSLSAVSGGASPKSYSYEQIANMPQEEFEALRNRMGPAKFDAKLTAMMGG